MNEKLKHIGINALHEADDGNFIIFNIYQKEL